jgi:hypothetical protein
MQTKKDIVKFLSVNKVYDKILDPLIDELIELISLRKEAYGKLKEEGMTEETNQGQKMSPYFSIYNTCQNQANALRARLGLSVIDAKKVDKPLKTKTETKDLSKLV